MASDASALALQPRSLAGHWWTVAGFLGNALRPPEAPPSVAWSESLEDPQVGPIEVTGRLSEDGGSRLLVILHGIAGCAESAYSIRAAQAAAEAGFCSLRLNLRGADRSGSDLFHAGLTADLHATLASPQLERFDSISVIGFSLGGHVALRAATEKVSERLEAVVAICSPLDLASCAAAFDRRRNRPYRRHILAALASIYDQVAARHALAFAPERVHRATTLREFDGLVVVPRFRFRDVDDYYSRMSVGPRLDELRVPALLVSGVSDPLVPIETVVPFLESAPERLTVHLEPSGGHVGFPSSLSLGFEGPVGLEPQALAWLESAPRRSF